jgi:hypothetical protein
LWTFATCVVLSHNTWSLGPLEDFEPAQRAYFQIHVLLWAPLHGAGLAALLLWAWRRVRAGEQIGAHPGHWFLIILGVDNAFGIADDWLLAGLSESEVQAVPDWAWTAHRYLIRAFGIAFYCAAVAQFRGFRWWQAAFALMALYPLSDIVHIEIIARFFRAWFVNQGPVWGTAIRMLHSAAIVFVIAAIVSDRRRGVRRDFLHFAGAATIMVQGILEWPIWITWWMIF